MLLRLYLEEGHGDEKRTSNVKFCDLHHSAGFGKPAILRRLFLASFPQKGS